MGLFEMNFASLGEWMRAGGCSQEEQQEAAVMLGSLQRIKEYTESHVNHDQTTS